MKNKSKHVIKLLGNILKKKYPSSDESQTVPFTDLLEWDLWPGFISLYGLNKQQLLIISIDYLTLYIHSKQSRSDYPSGDERGAVNLYMCHQRFARCVQEGAYW